MPSLPSLPLPRPVAIPLPWRHWFQRATAVPACYDLHVPSGGRPTATSVTRCAGDLPERLSLGPAGLDAISLRAHTRLRVACTAGTVWLTCEGDRRDHLLEVGNAYIARRGDALVLLGMPSAAVLVSID